MGRQPSWLELFDRSAPVPGRSYVQSSRRAEIQAIAAANGNSPLVTEDAIAETAPGSVLAPLRPRTGALRIASFRLGRGRGRFGGGRKAADGHQNAMQQRVRVGRTAGNVNVHG